MAAFIPTLRDGDVTIRPVKLRDARLLERELLDNRSWLRRWEATNPVGPMSFDVRGSIRNLLSHAREGFVSHREKGSRWIRKPAREASMRARVCARSEAPVSPAPMRKKRLSC